MSDSADDDIPMLGMDLPETAPPASSGPYRVLARKYRPQTFAELIGQDAMVRTLGNAIARDRLAHAFLMTGVRGVGKTSTARLIAKGLNCIGPDGQGGPTIDPCGQCDPCVAIAEGRHIDVIEMDAASHTGVDDMREIIEAVRYAAVSARYKIYIIDEVHMLSRNAFNALLKTLEEPPAHVKFLFATTEVNKVPVTVLSRCQRFDLRRITPELLQSHFARICALENVAVEDRALWMIASAAEGSVRDGLSILDQAIAHADMDADGRVTAAQVQEMLGLADGGATRNLFAMLLAGDAPAALDAVRAQYNLGVEPLAMLRGLMALCHAVALTRASRGDDPAQNPEDRAAVTAWAGQMGMARIQRLWQLLLRAHDEVARAAEPVVAAEMALLRIMHAGTMPDPDELARLIVAGGGLPVSADAGPAPTPVAAERPPAAMATPANDVTPAAGPSLVTQSGDDGSLSIATLAHMLADYGHYSVASFARRQLRCVSLEPGHLVIARSDTVGPEQAQGLAAALGSATGRAWQVDLSDAPGSPTLIEQAAAEAAAAEAALRGHPLVAAALTIFPDAELIPSEPREIRSNQA